MLSVGAWAVAMLALGAVTAAGMAGQQGTAESDLGARLHREQESQARAQLLDQWQQRHPNALWDEVRVAHSAGAELPAGLAKQMIEAAQGFLATLPASYDAAKRPAGATRERWEWSRKLDEALAYKTLGWVALQRRQWNDAERDFLEALRRTPGDAQVSAWTGTAVLRQKLIQTQWVGFYHFCRAAVWDGEGALRPEVRKYYLTWAEKNYLNLRETRDGLDEILEAARSLPFPPPSLLPRVEMIGAPEPELKRENPELALWVALMRGLTGADGRAFFDSVLRGRTVPGGVEAAGMKLYKFKATVVAIRNDTKRRNAVKEIVAYIARKDTPDVTLRLKDPERINVAPGITIEFSGVPIDFTADPFNMTFAVEAKDISRTGRAPVGARRKW